MASEKELRKFFEAPSPEFTLWRSMR